MNKLYPYIIGALILLGVPVFVLATTSVPWSIVNLTDTFISPNLVNGSAKGILVSASSTINGSLSVSTLTTGNCVQASTGGLLVSAVGACGSGSSGFPFTPAINYGALTNATNTPLWFQAGFQASSTAHLIDFDATGILTFASTSVNATSTLIKLGTIVFITGSSTAHNVSVGQGDMQNITGGADNNAFGDSVLANVTTGASNNALGWKAMEHTTTGASNLALGETALGANIDGSLNTAVGDASLFSLNTPAFFNAALGAGSLFTLTSGDYNIALGADAAFNQVSGTSNIAIGPGVDLPLLTDSQQLNIGNLLYGTSLYIGNVGQTSSAPVAGRLGVASTSPFATFSIQAINGSTASTIFAIGSSTQTATTTLFSVSNIGSTTLGRFGTCNTTSALTTSATGVITCGAISVTSTGAAYPFTPLSAFGTTTSATTSVLWVVQGIFASSTSYIASTTFSINGQVGVGSSTPFGQLSVDTSKLAAGIPSFVVGSSTRTDLSINQNGNLIVDSGIATSTSGATNKAFLGRFTNTYSTTTPSTAGVPIKVVFTGAEDTAPSFSGTTLTLPSNVAYFVVELWGAGGGGGGGGASPSAGGVGSNGTATAFGTGSATTTADFGRGGASGAVFTVASLSCTTAVLGGVGGSIGSGGDFNAAGQSGDSSLGVGFGSDGGSTVRGGTGGVELGANVTNGAVGNSPGGGGAGGSFCGPGGGAGAYARDLIPAPLATTFYFDVGKGGGGGTAGGSAGIGGAGAAGGILLEIYTY